MKPSDLEHKIELFEARLKVVNFSARTALADARQTLSYRLSVPPEKDRAALTTAQTFAGEAVDFLRQDPSGILAPIQPTRDQLGLVGQILASTERGDLELTSVGRARTNVGPPILSLCYQTRSESALTPNHDLQATLTREMNRQEAQLGVTYDPDREFPLGMSISGRKGFSFLVGTIELIILPKIPDSSDDMGRSTLGRVEVYESGRRIIQDRQGSYRGRTIETTNQFRLLGGFTGEGTEKDYYVYGHNQERHTKTTIRPGVQSIRQLVSQTVILSLPL